MRSIRDVQQLASSVWVPVAVALLFLGPPLPSAAAQPQKLGGEGHGNAAAEPLRQTNLIRNPSFEQGVGFPVSSGKPVFWTNWTVYPYWVRSVYNRSTLMFDDGSQPPVNASLRYDNTDPTQYQVVSQFITGGVAGVRYSLTASIRSALTSPASAGAATVAAEWNRKSGKFYGGFYPVWDGAAVHAWQTVGGEFTLPADADASSLKVSAYVRPTSGTGPTPVGRAWWDNFRLAPAQPLTPLRVVLVSPTYRGQVTAAAADATVSVRAHVQPAAGGASSILLVATLSPEGAVCPPISTAQAGPFTMRGIHEPLQVNLSLSSIDARTALRVGRRYSLEVQCINASLINASMEPLSSPHRVIAAQTFNLTRVDETKPPPAVSIDSRKRTLVRGKAFFPMGWYYNGFPSAAALANLSRSPWNAIMPYGETSTLQMDAAHAAGLRVAFSLKDIFFGSANCPAAVTSLREEEFYFKRRVASVKGKQ